MKKKGVILGVILLFIVIIALLLTNSFKKNRIQSTDVTEASISTYTYNYEKDINEEIKSQKHQEKEWIKAQADMQLTKETKTEGNSAPKTFIVAAKIPALPFPAPPTPSPAPAPSRLIDRLKCAGDSKQVILVQASSFGTYHVTISTYEKVNGNWQEILSNIPGVIGKNGFSVNRHEGDYSSPVGSFGFITFFGWNGNPGFKMPFRAAGSTDYWVSDNINNEYNTWVQYSGDPEQRFGHNNYEDLGTQPLYKYAAAIDYNYGPGKVVGKGSAIFLHISPPSGGGTAGCTAMPEDKLLKVLQWMDPSKNPIIVQGPLSELSKM